MTDWDGHVLRSHPTLSVKWGRETKVTVPHDLELSCDVTQLQCHQHFTWRLPHFMVQAERSRIDFVATLPSVQFSRIFVNFSAGPRLQLIPSTGPRDHMPLTLGLMTGGGRDCPDPTRGRWDHEKIEEMLSDPIARLTFFQELQTNIRNSTVVGRAATDATLDDALEKSCANYSRNSWSLLLPRCATIHPTARIGTATPFERFGHSTTSDRGLSRSETCGKTDATTLTLALAKEKGKLA